mgnify:FL=1
MRLFLAVLPWLTGCATLGTFQSAETVGQGNWEVGIEPSMWGGIAADTTVLYPHAAVSARVGLSDRFDIGGRVGSGGVEANAKLGLTDRDADVPISVGAGVGGMAVGAAGSSVSILAVHVPVLFGIRTGENQLVLGPKVHVYSFGASSGGSAASAALWSLGGSVGYVAGVGPTVKLVPELAFALPVLAAGSAGTTTDTIGVSDGALLQVGLGIVIGRGD